MAWNICCVLTVHEQALAAYHGQTDTSVYEHLISNNMPWNGVKLIPDVKLTLGTSLLCIVLWIYLTIGQPQPVQDLLVAHVLWGTPWLVAWSAASTLAKQRPVPKPAFQKNHTAGSKWKTDSTVVKPSVGASTTGDKRKAVEEPAKSEKRVTRSSHLWNVKLWDIYYYTILWVPNDHNFVLSFLCSQFFMIAFTVLLLQYLYSMDCFFPPSLHSHNSTHVYMMASICICVCFVT